jgi:predicted dehydrogenase
MDTIGIGLMGLGYWAADAYAPILAEIDGVRVTAVSARSDETFAQARELFGEDVNQHRDLADLAQDQAVDAVMAALPNRLHAEGALAAIDAGKPLFAEPPLGFDEGEIKRVLAAAEQAPAPVQTDLELRYVPVVQRVAEMASAGDLGSHLMATIRLWCDWGYGGGEWLEEAEDQGFFLWLGCWYVDVLDAVFGAGPERVSVTGGRAMNGNMVDHAWATMEYPRQRLGQFEFSLVAPDEQQITLTVTGTEREVEADLWTGELRSRGRGEEWERTVVPNSEPIHGFAGMRESITDFIASVRGGSQPRANLAVSRRVHAAALACVRSVETGETVAVEPL